MCLCGVVLSGIFLQKHCWNFFILFVKGDRHEWSEIPHFLEDIFDTELCQGVLWITFLIAVSRRGRTRKAPLCLSSFCPHCLYHNSFYMLSMTNWRRVHGRRQGKNFFRRQLQHCTRSMQTSIWPQTAAYFIFINNIIVIFLSTGTDNITISIKMKMWSKLFFWRICKIL